MSSEIPKAVFLSYASQDAEAARRLCDALRAADVEVWFDQSELRGGDQWDAKIKKQIRECALFVPVISANTQARLEGYFRLEWKLAEDRSHLMAKGKPFIVPVSVDGTTERAAHVPDAFLAVQWTRLPGGEAPPQFCERVKNLLGGGVAPASSRPSETAGKMPALPEPVGRRFPAAAWGVALVVVVLVAGGYSWLKRPVESAPISAQIPGARMRPPTSGKSASASVVSDKSLVVLPLENLSPDPENAFFTDGMHAEIISTLSQIAELKVISRNSALAFKGSTASLAEIAQKLGVANVLTGSVRRAGNTVRIQLELRRASDEALLWSLPKGDRELKGVLGLQSEVADQVARVLQARASKGSFASAQFTTKDPRAYDLFLKAHQLFDWRGLNNQLESVRLAEEAMRLDPNYATAANLLSHSHQRVFSQDPNPETRVQHARDSKRWGEITQKLMPGGAGDGALSMYYSITEHDGVRALPLAENVQRALPNDAESYNYLGVAVEELGRFHEAVDCFMRAEEISPQVANYPRNLLRLYARLRREPDARAAAERYRALSSAPAPENANRHSILDGLFIVSGDRPPDLSGLTGAQKAIWLWRARRFESALMELEAVMKSDLPEYPTRLAVLRLKCDTFRRLGRDSEAADVAREAITLATKLQSASEIGPTEKPGWLAVAYSRAGRMDEAVAAMGRYVDASSPTNQTNLHWEREVDAAELYSYANRPRECVELLAKLLRVPSGLTVPMLKVDPTWDNVREDAGFKALLADPKNSALL